MLDFKATTPNSKSMTSVNIALFGTKMHDFKHLFANF